MRTLVSLFVVILLMVGFYMFFIVNPKNYEIEYKLSGFEVIERYDKTIEGYTFDLTKDNQVYSFGTKMTYSPSRKLINDISEVKQDNKTCVSINVSGIGLSPICYLDGRLYDASLDEIVEPSLIDKKNNIEVYNNKYKYFVWNGYGLTNVLTGKKYNVLKNETYNNSGCYIFGKYILFANYDESKQYSTFYLFDMDSEEYKELNVSKAIDTNFYYLGNYDDLVYLFDKKNSVEYSLSIPGGKLLPINESDGGYIYTDSEKEYLSLQKLKYENIKFTFKNLNNYLIKDKKLYLNYYGSSANILISNNPIEAIITNLDDKVFYLASSSLYSYSADTKEEKLLTNFEWNFSYSNKIFVYYN